MSQEGTTIPEVLRIAEDEMKHSLEFLHQELHKVRAGKAAPAMLEGIRIDYYGSLTPISQVSTISVADARTLTIQPFEKQHLNAIERAIAEANLGVGTGNDGIVVRVSFPMLTEERRKELVKKAKEVCEDARVGIRNHRRKANETLKKLQKNGTPEDSVKTAENDVQKLTDKYNAEVDAVLKKKEDEIMTV